MPCCLELPPYRLFLTGSDSCWEPASLMTMPFTRLCQGHHAISVEPLRWAGTRWRTSDRWWQAALAPWRGGGGRRPYSSLVILGLVAPVASIVLGCTWGSRLDCWSLTLGLRTENVGGGLRWTHYVRLIAYGPTSQGCLSPRNHSMLKIILSNSPTPCGSQDQIGRKLWILSQSGLGDAFSFGPSTAELGSDLGMRKFRMLV